MPREARDEGVGRRWERNDITGPLAPDSSKRTCTDPTISVPGFMTLPLKISATVRLSNQLLFNSSRMIAGIESALGK
eukprot:88139-Prymnesium_polylepis.1